MLNSNGGKKMIICKTCGAQIADNVKFCSQCGTSAAESIQSNVASEPAINTMYTQTPPSAVNTQTPPDNFNSQIPPISPQIPTNIAQTYTASGVQPQYNPQQQYNQPQYNSQPQYQQTNYSNQQYPPMSYQKTNSMCIAGFVVSIV